MVYASRFIAIVVLWLVATVAAPAFQAAESEPAGVDSVVRIESRPTAGAVLNSVDGRPRCACP
jgi:hypothetical protein